jgi:stearoyl-CoA desaturase (delta-9 desaturase)
MQGWIFEKPYYPKLKFIDISDLMSDPIVVFQHKFYPLLAITSGLVLPTLVAWVFWNDPIGGYLYGGIIARLLTWHATFCINSFAHWIGEQHFSKETTAKGNFLLALFTVGEGYHNFHHEFPKDYRNGIHWNDFDPTKWCIWVASRFGLAYDLHEYEKDDIKKGISITGFFEQTILTLPATIYVSHYIY